MGKAYQQKNKVPKIIFYFIVLIFIFYSFSPKNILAQEANLNKNENLIISKNLVSDIASINVQYLGISVFIILLFGGISWVTDKKRVEKYKADTDREFKILKENIEEDVSTNIHSLMEKFKKQKKEIYSLRGEANRLFALLTEEKINKNKFFSSISFVWWLTSAEQFFMIDDEAGVNRGLNSAIRLINEHDGKIKLDNKYRERAMQAIKSIDDEKYSKKIEKLRKSIKKR